MLPYCRVLRVVGKPTPELIGQVIDRSNIIFYGTKIVFARPLPCIVSYTTYIEEVSVCNIEEEELDNNILVKHICGETIDYYIYPKDIWMEIKTKYIEPLSKGKPPYTTGLLLYGPPGTGKSSLANILATSFGLYVETIDPGIQGSFLGETEKNIKKKLENVEHNTPSCLIGDEIDWLLESPAHAKISGVAASLVGALDMLKSTMQQWYNKRLPLLFIATTNRDPKGFEQAFLRVGRFKPMMIPLPDLEAVRQLMIIRGVDEKQADILARKIINAGLPMSDVVGIIEDVLEGREPKIESRRYRGYSRYVPNPTSLKLDKLKNRLPPKMFDNPLFRLLVLGDERIAFPVIAEYLFKIGKPMILLTDPRYIDEAIGTAEAGKAVLIVLTDYIPDDIQKTIYNTAHTPIVFVGTHKPAPMYTIDVLSVFEHIDDMIQLLLDFYGIKYTQEDLEDLSTYDNKAKEELVFLIRDLSTLTIKEIKEYMKHLAK